MTLVPGSPVNLKISTKEDLRLAEQAIKALPKPKLSGPLHPFADDDLAVVVRGNSMSPFEPRNRKSLPAKLTHLPGANVDLT